jgi:hypothetical protein
MGPLHKVLEMMPGMGDLLKLNADGGHDAARKIKSYMTIMDSMTHEGVYPAPPSGCHSSPLSTRIGPTASVR